MVASLPPPGGSGGFLFISLCDDNGLLSMPKVDPVRSMDDLAEADGATKHAEKRPRGWRRGPRRN